MKNYSSAMKIKFSGSMVLLLTWCLTLTGCTLYVSSTSPDSPSSPNSSEDADSSDSQQQNIRHGRSRMHFSRINRRVVDHTLRFVENFLDKPAKTRTFSAITAFDSLSLVSEYNSSNAADGMEEKFAYTDNRTNDFNTTGVKSFQNATSSGNFTDKDNNINETLSDLEFAKSFGMDVDLTRGSSDSEIPAEDDDTNFVSENILYLDHTSRINDVSPRSGNVDIVTRFLRIVESQHLLGENCTAGTDLNLGEGVVDRYAQERFRVEADVAVNRANMLTRIWKYADPSVVMSEYFLHASVFSMVEFDDDIFAAGNCYDQYQYKDYWLFCPYAYRLPEGPILVKDLAVEYKYLSNTSEWFYIARKNAENVIRNYNQFSRGKSSHCFPIYIIDENLINFSFPASINHFIDFISLITKVIYVPSPICGLIMYNG